MGHIRQLPKDSLGFNIDNNYEPTFEIMPDKVDIVKKIIILLTINKFVYK